MVDIAERVKSRLPNETVDDNYIIELIMTVKDRLNIRLGTLELPFVFESILVDATIKMYRRQYHEGIKSESVDTINTHFIEDILQEYELDIAAYKQGRESDLDGSGLVRFL